MQLNTRTANTRSDHFAFDHLKTMNSTLQHQLLKAQHDADNAIESRKNSEIILEAARKEIADARKTVADLERQVKELTASLNDALGRKSKKEKKYGYNSGNSGMAIPTSPYSISVNNAPAEPDQTLQ